MQIFFEKYMKKTLQDEKKALYLRQTDRKSGESREIRELSRNCKDAIKHESDPGFAENTRPLNKCARDTGRCKMQQFISIRSFRHSVFSFEKKGGSK